MSVTKRSTRGTFYTPLHLELELGYDEQLVVVIAFLLQKDDVGIPTPSMHLGIIGLFIQHIFSSSRQQ